MDAEASPADIEYKDNELTIRLNTTTLHLVKGEKSAEELLKDAGLYHVDELQIVNNSITSLGNGFFKIVYEIKIVVQKLLYLRVFLLRSEMLIIQY